MHPATTFNRRPTTIGLLAIAALLSTSSGCVVDMVQHPRQAMIAESQGVVLVPAETVEFLECYDGLLLYCETGFGRLSDRECRCLR